MPLSLDLLPVIDEQEDIREYLRRLVSVVNDNTDRIAASAAGGTVYIVDNQGRPIVTPDGIYGYNAAGDVPIAPNIVQIDTSDLVDAAVELAKIADDAVSTAKIQDAAILSAKIADAAIITAKIGDLQVVTAKIDDLAVNSAKIANLAVTSAKIDNLAVGTAHIQALAVTTAKIDNLAVTAAKIANATITNAQIALATIQGANIASATITAANIANATITTAQIASATIQGANIALATITGANIANATITDALIANATITGAKIANATINTANIANLAVTTALIANGAILTAKIADAQITTAKIVDLAVSSAKINDLAVTTAKLNDLAVTTAKIGSLAVTDAKINDLAVNKLTAGTIGSITINLGTSAVVLSGTDRRITVTDENSVVRVRMGRLGAGAANYGLEIYDASGNTIVSATGLGVNVVGQNQIVRESYITSSSQSKTTPTGVAGTSFTSIINSGGISITPSTQFPYMDIKGTAALRITGGTALTGCNFRLRIATPSGDLIPFAHWLALQQLSIGDDYRTISTITYGFSMLALSTGTYTVHLEASRPYGDATVEVDHCILSVLILKKAV